VLTPAPSRKLAASLLACMLAVVGAGCSGSSDDSVATPAPAFATANAVEIEARTGPILIVRVGDTVTLDGNRSFTSSADALSFRWSFSSRPAASNAELQNAAAANPSFVADVSGTYVAQLVVSAGSITSQRAVQLVAATVPPEPGVFHDGLSSNCINCHNDSLSDITSKPPDHVASSNLCATCHTPTHLGFSAIHVVDHQEVFGNCSGCHNGVTAIGKSEFHVQTVVECDACHNTSHFLALEPDGSFDHSGIARSCSGCHNGTVAQGKTPTPPHPDTDSECGACHTTATFQGAFPDHTGPDVVGNRCDACHGISATGQTDGHPLTFVDCATCHSTVTFSLDGVFNHRVVDATVQPCESCHNDSNSINAPAKSSAVPAHPATSEDCGSCHDTDSFAGAFVDHTGIVDNCASCHGVTASGKSDNHMPTIDDCSACHTPGNFSTGTYDHAGVINNCESCHNNVITLGKLPEHIPTNEDCAACHNTVDFAAATFAHVGIDINNCASCHDDGVSIGKPDDHLPTALDCSSCHDTTNFSTFAGITFNHLGIDPDNCAACHSTGIATPKKTDHIPADEDCSVCHDSTVAFSSTTFLFTSHQDITRGCEGCHVGQFFVTRPDLVKAAGHLPTDQDCSDCHTTAAFKPSIFDHAGIADNCASCHDGSASHVALGALGKTASPVHQNTSSDCSVCHDTISFAAAFVDHTSPIVLDNSCVSCHNGTDATGKNAKPDHVVTSEDCGTCHVPGGTFAPAVFNHTGIVDNCASCHDGNAATGKAAKTDAPHIPTTEDCSTCHTPAGFAGARFDHLGIVGNCVACHDGNVATGKADTHVPTNGDCSDCHVTAGFKPAAFDHVGIVDNCASCHAAGFATPKDSDHVVTSQDCGACHNTRGFIPATFDHTGIIDNCASCHGVTARGLSPDHIPTSLDCSFCHTTATFVGGTFDHQGISSGCATCHDGTTAVGSEPQGLNDHFITVAECNDCHSTQAWAPINFTHPLSSDYPGDHSINLACSSCHKGNDENIAFSWPQYAPFCAACHANDFDRKGNHIGGENGTVEQNKDCSGGGRGCHRVSDRDFD